ncbi:dihydroxy-acid dehydratase [Chloropicon primus]|nr:dihydroxy-acid dehydratase [Chloropicon primus]
MLMLRTMEEGGVVRAMSGVSTDVSPIPSTRHEFMRSISSIFSGETSTHAHASGNARKSPYIVVFKSSQSVDSLRTICSQYGMLMKSNSGDSCHMPEVCRRVYASTFRGISGYFSQGQLQKLLTCFEGAVDFVEKDKIVYKAEQRVAKADDAAAARIQSGGSTEYPVTKQMMDIGGALEAKLSGGGPSASGLPAGGQVSAFSRNQVQDLNVALWNLDRVDQRSLPLDGKYTHSGSAGKGVTIYTVDSGLRKTHQEFQEWDSGKSRAAHGYDFVDDHPNADDCDGHGTHVAGTAVGRTTGVAKDAKVVGVRVLDCSGSGSVSDVIAGLDWVANHHQKPAIVTMSLGIGVGSWSRALEEAVKNLIVDYGITVIVASGNSGVDSCYVAPGNVEEPITVAASDLGTKFGQTSGRDQETLYRWSNTGECIDIFAPGVDIYSACGGDSRCNTVTDSAYAWASGTSMAVPLVAGVAANYLSENPNASPAEVKRVILSAGTRNALSSPHMKPGSPNLLLYSEVGQSRPVTTHG